MKTTPRSIRATISARLHILEMSVAFELQGESVPSRGTTQIVFSSFSTDPTDEGASSSPYLRRASRMMRSLESACSRVDWASGETVSTRWT